VARRFGDDGHSAKAIVASGEEWRNMNDAIMLCDFCSGLDPAWRYPARSFIAYCTPDLAGESVGDWAACECCHDLIEANDRAGLVQRSLDELVAKHPETKPAAAVFHQHLTELHDQFFAHRCGAAAPVRENAA